MKKTFIIFSVAALCAVSVLSSTSCKKSSSSSTPASTMTLYDSLGGTTKVIDPSNPGDSIEAGYLAIRSVVDSTIFVIAGDTAINGHFAVLLAEVGSGNLSGFTALSNNLTNFMAVATGAKDYTYGGKSMPDAHNPSLNSRMTGVADNGDMNAFEADLGVGATQCKVPTYLINRVAALVETLRSQVVNQ